jgi:peptide deformylase
VQAWDRHAESLDFEVWGLSAGTFQHETDHLDGTIFVDRVTDPHTLCTWETFRAHHEQAFVERVRALVARFGS